MLLSNCDVCGKIFDEDHEEIPFCNHCSQYKCYSWGTCYCISCYAVVSTFSSWS